MASDSRRLRVGLIGGGFGINTVLPAIKRAGASVTAFCHPDKAKAKRIAAELQIPSWATTADEIAIRRDVDLIWVASPPGQHWAQTLASLRRGKPVICEKPLAASAAQAREMLDEAESRHLLHVVDHEFRFVAQRSLVKRLLAKSAIGNVAVVSVIDNSSRLRDSQTPAPEWWLRRDMSGGQLGAVGSHWIDSLTWWLGEVEDVTARLTITYPERPTAGGFRIVVTADDTFSLVLKFSSGAIATVQSSCVSPETLFDVRLVGDKGSIQLGNAGDLIVSQIDGRERLLMPPSAGPRASGATQLEELNALCRIVRYAARSLLGQSATRGFTPIATFQDGLVVQELLDRAYESPTL